VVGVLALLGLLLLGMDCTGWWSWFEHGVVGVVKVVGVIECLRWLAWLELLWSCGGWVFGVIW